MNDEIAKGFQRGDELKAQRREQDQMTAGQAVSIAIERVTDLDLSLDPDKDDADSTAGRFMTELRGLGFEVRPR